MIKEDCLFCKIIAGEIPSYKIFEDDVCFAFLDISCDVEGHTLVVPKEHCDDVLDCPQETLKHLMMVAQKIAKSYVDHCGYTGVNFTINSGKSSGQEIPHLHIHIIPRKDTDNFSIYANLQHKEMDLNIIQKKLKLN